jgi:hypothetical protein
VVDDVVEGDVIPPGHYLATLLNIRANLLRTAEVLFVPFCPLQPIEVLANTAVLDVPFLPVIALRIRVPKQSTRRTAVTIEVSRDEQTVGVQTDENGEVSILAAPGVLFLSFGDVAQSPVKVVVQEQDRGIRDIYLGQ